MKVYWDHTVHYVNHLDQAVDEFVKSGVHAFRGGSHTEWGTYNALSYFGLPYVEFLAIEKHEQACANRDVNAVVFDAVRFLPEKEIIGRIALRTNDIEGVAVSLHEKGVETSEVVAGSRLTKEGRLLQWKMLTIYGDVNGVVYPFLIEWGESDEVRLGSLAEQGFLQAENVELKEAIIFAPQPELVAARWSYLFNLSHEGETTVNVGEHRFIFQEGRAEQSMVLVFETDVPRLKGQTISIGEGTYLYR